MVPARARSLSTAALVLVTAACSVTAIEQRTPATSAPRTAGPDFTLASHRGDQISLHDVTAGHHVVLVFYRGHW